MFPRLKSEIPLSGKDGNRTGDIALADLFNHFVHNRYLFLDAMRMRGFCHVAPIYAWFWSTFVKRDQIPRLVVATKDGTQRG